MADLTLRQAGIYCITHVPTGLVYIGSSQNIRIRWMAHQHALQAGRHRAKRMLQAWASDGPAAFTIAVLEGFPEFKKTDEARLIAREQAWLDKLRPHDPAVGFNSAPWATGGGPANHSPETRAKLSAALKGCIRTPETRAKISAYATGRTHSPETLEKLAAAGMGRPASPETRAKRSTALRGRKPSPLAVARTVETKTGRPLSPETKAKMSAAAKLRWQSPEARAKQSAAITGRKHSPETLARMSGAQKKRSPESMASFLATAKNPSAELRAKRSAALKGHKHSPETRAKLVEAWKHRAPPSAKTRKKLSAAAKRHTPEHIAKLSAAGNAARWGAARKPATGST
jgi:group I intron endonuclease